MVRSQVTIPRRRFLGIASGAAASLLAACGGSRMAPSASVSSTTVAASVVGTPALPATSTPTTTAAPSAIAPASPTSVPPPTPTPAPQPTIPFATVFIAGLTQPAREPGIFWIPDQPKDLSPLALGVLPREAEPGSQLNVGSYLLTAPLPTSPAEAGVYVVGAYPDSDKDVFTRMVVRAGEAWDFVPEYSLVQCRTPLPADATLSVSTEAQAAQRATRVLMERGLLRPDSGVSAVAVRPDGAWSVSFLQRIDGVPVYANKGLTVSVGRDGVVTGLLGRRRPLLARSRYPLRTPQDAWQLLAVGQGRPFYVDDGAPVLWSGQSMTIAPFTVSGVELAYAETEVLTNAASQGRQPAAQQIMQPYYVFRDARGYTLYVPAVAAPQAP
ncbi:MAG: hypothetical protein ACR2M3_06890 [Thermomicrobiales bacterium]